MLHYVQCRQCHRFTNLWTDHQGVRESAPGVESDSFRCAERGGARPAPPALLSIEDRLRNDVCRVCGCVLSLRQVIGRTCDDPQCEAADRQAQLRRAARKTSRQLRHAVVVRAKARRWFRIMKQQSPAICSLHGKATGTLAVLLLPANTRRLAWLPESRKRAFINELESLVSTMRQDGAHEAATPQQVDVGRPADESSERGPWEQSCALCGGCCCQSEGRPRISARLRSPATFIPSGRWPRPCPKLVSYFRLFRSEGAAITTRGGCTLPGMRSECASPSTAPRHHRVHEWFQAEAEPALGRRAGAMIHRIALFDGRLARHPPPAVGWRITSMRLDYSNGRGMAQPCDHRKAHAWTWPRPLRPAARNLPA